MRQRQLQRIYQEIEKEVRKRTTCSNCKCDIDFNSSYTGIDNEVFCEKCFYKSYDYCSVCGVLLKSENAYFSKIQERAYCEDCKTDLLFFCKGCADELHEDSIFWINEEVYCEKCFFESYK